MTIPRPPSPPLQPARPPTPDPNLAWILTYAPSDTGLGTRDSAPGLSTRVSAPGTQHPGLSTWDSAPGTQHPGLSTQESAPKTQHPRLGPQNSPPATEKRRVQARTITKPLRHSLESETHYSRLSMYDVVKALHCGVNLIDVKNHRCSLAKVVALQFPPIFAGLPSN